MPNIVPNHRYPMDHGHPINQWRDNPWYPWQTKEEHDAAIAAIQARQEAQFPSTSTVDTVATLLHSTTDAQVWAREWCRIAKAFLEADDGRLIIDEGWMTGWFANAIEVGRAAGQVGMER